MKKCERCGQLLDPQNSHYGFHDTDDCLIALSQNVDQLSEIVAELQNSLRQTEAEVQLLVQYSLLSQ